MMYDELVSRLRRCASYDPRIVIQDCNAAADAIENTSKAYQMMAEAYEAEVTKNRWIPVTEQLPEPYRNVLLYSGEEFYTGYMHNDKRFTVNASSFPERPTHWMPLPQPPKEDG